MRVGVEASNLLVKQKTGIERYTTELVSALIDVLPQHKGFELILYFHAGDPNSDHDLVKYYQDSFVTVKKRFYFPRRWYRVALLSMTCIDRIELLHFPTPIIPLVKPYPTVMTFHDINLDLHDDETRKGVLGALIHSDYCIAVSEDTRNALIKHGFDANNIAVIYEALPNIFFPDIKSAKQVREKYKLQDYILCVGTFHPRKNHSGLLSAYYVMRKEFGVTHSLVMVGRKGPIYEELMPRIYKLGLQDHIKILDYVPDDEMRGLYSGADLYVLPSFHEGFGLTVLEAMACGTPTVVSNIGSLPEIAKNAVEYFNPRDIQEMATMMNCVLKNETLQLRLRNEGFSRVKEFNWTITANRTIETYHNLTSHLLK